MWSSPADFASVKIQVIQRNRLRSQAVDAPTSYGNVRLNWYYLEVLDAGWAIRINSTNQLTRHFWRAFFVSCDAYFFSASRICSNTSSSLGPAGAAAATSFLLAASLTRFTILTSKKTTKAMIRKLITAVKNDP
jgi:hypothetical protein